MPQAAVLRLLYFLVFCCTASWLPVLADYCRSKGFTGTQTSLILSITPVMMFAVQPLYGMLADKVGYKKTVQLASFFASLSYLGYLLEGGFAWLIGVTVVMSLFYNTLQPVLDSLSLQFAEQHPKFSYGTLRVAGAAGWSFTGILTGQVIDAISINAIFLVSFSSMALLFAGSFFLKETTEKKATAEASPFAHASKLFRDSRLFFFLLCVFIVSAGATTIWNFYSTYMKENGASASLVGYGLSFQGLCEIPLFYFSAAIISRIGLKTTLVLTVMATVVRLLLYGFIKNPVAALPVELLHGLSWSLFWVACVEYVNRQVEEQWRATGQSLLYASYFGAGAIAGNYWTGYLYDSGLKIAGILFLNAAVVAVVVVLLLLFLRQKRLRTQMVKGES